MTGSLRTRHIAILVYGGITAMAIYQGILNDATNLIAVLAPLGGMFVWDKLKGTP